MLASLQEFFWIALLSPAIGELDHFQCIPSFKKMNQFYRKGYSLFREAVDFDEGKEYEKALDKYILGIEYFLTGMKCRVSR